MDMNFLSGITEFTLQMFEESGYTDADVLNMSKVLLAKAIPCLDTLYPTLPTEEQESINFAVLEMASFLKVDHTNFDAITSPFSSETIGSYTYHKMNDATTAINRGMATGVPAFDRAVSIYAPMCGADSGTAMEATSEQVFKPGFEEFLHSREYGNSYHWKNGIW